MVIKYTYLKTIDSLKKRFFENEIKRMITKMQKKKPAIINESSVFTFKIDSKSYGNVFTLNSRHYNPEQKIHAEINISLDSRSLEQLVQQ